MARDLALEKEWRDRIEECRRSGLSAKIWCMQNGLRHTAYYYWIKRFKILDQDKSRENIFAEVVLPSESKNIIKATRPIAAKLSLSFGDYSIGIEDGFNPHTLAELVQVLRKQ